MEQKFGLIRCTETQKPLFAAQQLRGPASTWWGNFVAIQPAGHQVTWDEFKLAFREHYIPEGVLHMKQEEFMRLNHLAHPPTHSNSMSSFTLPLPPLLQVSRVPLVLVSPPSLVPQLATSIVGSLDILSRTAHIRGRTNPTINKTQGTQIKARETWQIIQRARILRRLGEYITLKWPLHQRESRL